jgi:carbonic anhydrase/acetyltransferase-like protein (isoleucine patch superfamily)
MPLITVNNHTPILDETAWLAPGAVLAGQVSISKNASIWYNAVVRGDMDSITIGARTNVQDGCVLHADPGAPLAIGEGVSVGHNAVLHGCTVGDDVLIGMGAVVMNGATIGDECVIAAGAVIPEGMAVEARSLVAGVPGKVRRQCTDNDVAHIRRNAGDYVTLAARHRSAPHPTR